jgi:hypothetical protein
MNHEKHLTESKLDTNEITPVDMIDLSNAIDQETPVKKSKTEAMQDTAKEDTITQWFSKGDNFTSNSLLQFC